MPEGGAFFPQDQITDRNERFWAEEVVRDQIIAQMRQEIPYAVAVSVEDMKDRPDGTKYIKATIYVEKESQKGIVIGAGGAKLKSIGSAARATLEQTLSAKVYLDLSVKLWKNWRSDAAALRRLGY